MFYLKFTAAVVLFDIDTAILQMQLSQGKIECCRAKTRHPLNESVLVTPLATPLHPPGCYVPDFDTIQKKLSMPLATNKNIIV